MAEHDRARLFALRALALVLAALSADAASAQEPARVRPGEELPFKPRYHGVTLAEWVVTPLVGTFAAAGFFVPPRDRTSGPWPNDVDRAGQRALRLSTPALRDAAGLTSDLLVAGLFAWEAFDAWGMAGLVHHSVETAETLTFIDVETHFIVAGLQNWAAVIGSRERPFGASCGPAGATTTPERCESDFRYRSFFSGHASHTFAAAALTCTHHQFLPGLGGLGDPMPCLATLGVAATTGMLRILADVHFVSDVITGAIVGSLAGFLVPYLFHYAHNGGADSGMHIALVPYGAGAGVVGVF